jgi:protein-disulfide isomerase
MALVCALMSLLVGAACDSGDKASASELAADTPTRAQIDAALEQARQDVAKESKALGETKSEEPVEPVELEGSKPQEEPEANASAKDSLEALPGLDISQLNPRTSALALSILEGEPSACGKSHSLATSVKIDPGCIESQAVAQLVIDNIRTGRSELSTRTLAAQVSKALVPQPMNTGGRPVYGSARAPVTLVVFADFECPHCAREAPRLRRAVDESRRKAKMVYKHFPLSHHPAAKRAAAASEAVFAQNPDAFWKLHAWIFANQRKLFSDPESSDEKIRKQVETLGISMARYDSFVVNKRGVGTVSGDHSDGRRVGVSGTPVVFVNGRRLDSQLWSGSLKKWIEFALR